MDKRITKLGRRQWHHRQTTLFPWKQRKWKEDGACYACSYRIGWKRKWNPHVLKFKDPVFLCNDTSHSLLQQKAYRAWYTPFRVRDNQNIYIYTRPHKDQRHSKWHKTLQNEWNSLIINYPNQQSSQGLALSDS